MPTYDYLCRSCGHRFEMFHSIMAEPIRECPVCKQKKVTRLLTGGAGLIFKGSGFYITDYKNKKTPPVADSAKPEKKPVTADKKKTDPAPKE